MDTPKDYHLHVSDGKGGGIAIIVPWDTAAPGWANTFRTIMYGLGFEADTINDTIPDPERDWSYDDGEGPGGC